MSDMTGLPSVDPQVAEGPQGSTGPDLPMMTPPIDAPPPIERVPVRGYSSSQFPTDPYLQQQEAQRRQQDDLSVMMRIRQAITEGDADAVAEAERLSLKTGLTISSIRENANTARGIAAALDARDARYGESNPVLYREMMDPLFASTAADDVRNLSWYERLGKGFDRGQLMVEQGQLAWKLMRSGQLSEPESAKLTEITRQMDAYAFDDGMWALTGETVGQMSQTMPVALGAGAVAAGLVGAVTGGSGAAPTFAAVTGLVGYSQTAEIEGGLAFLQYKRSGMDHRTAVTNATMVGRINGLVEMLPLGTVGGQFAKAGRNFARRGASQIASKKGMRGAVRRMMAQRTAKRSWSNTAKNWALGTAAEVSAEMVQETVTALGEYYGQVDTQALRTAQVGEVAGDFNMPGGGTIRTLPDGTVQVSNEILDIVDGVIPIGSAGRRANEFHTLTPQQAQEVIADLDRLYPLESVLHDETMASDIINLTSDTAWSALKGMWLVGAAGPLMQHASERAQVKKSEIDHQVFADNVGKASDSKLNKRSPSAFARFWQLQADEGDDSVFISRTDLDEKMSGNGITIDDLEQVFPGIKDQYELDPESHPDIEIPKGEAVSKFANNQLFDIFKDVLRPNQEAISQKDLEQMGPNIEAQQKVLEAQLAEDEQVVDARDTELDVIEEVIANQLVAAGTKVSMARVQAAWSRSYVAVRALAKTKQLGRQVLPSEIRLPSIVSNALYEQGPSEAAASTNVAVDAAKPSGGERLLNVDGVTDTAELRTVEDVDEAIAKTKAKAKAKSKGVASLEGKRAASEIELIDLAVLGRHKRRLEHARDRGTSELPLLTVQEEAPTSREDLEARMDAKERGEPAPAPNMRGVFLSDINSVEEVDALIASTSERMRNATTSTESAQVVDPESVAAPYESDLRQLEARRKELQGQQDENFNQLGDYEFDEGNYRPAVVTWAKDRFGDRVAPNGKPTWQNFVVWFGDSQVVDESGAPLVVYHGGESKIDEFDTARSNGFFFAYDEDVAEVYGPEITSVFVKADNVLKSSSANDVIEALRSSDGASSESIAAFDAYAGKPTQELLWNAARARANSPLGRGLFDLSMEFDAVAFTDDTNTRGSGELDHSSLFVFDPTQVKSTQNRGTFDSSDPNILRATEGTVRRGSFDKRTGQIILGRDHNGSTFFHEWSHFHLQVLIEDVAAGTATEQDIKDLETIAKWGGHANAQAFIDASPAAHRATHEAWAAAFERYLYENKADSAEMRSVFRRVADLLIESWRQIKRIGENYQRIYGQPLPVMNPEITAVMDRLMMTDDQITTRMQQDAVSKLLNGVEVTPEEQATLDDLYFNQESEAKEELRKRFMKQLRKLRSFRGRELKRLQSASRKARKEAEENARDTLLRDEPRARLVHWLTTGELIEFAPDGEMIVREKLADTAKIATTDPRVPKKFRRLSPELAEDMQLEAELELIEAEEVLAEQEPVLLERIEGLKAEIANDQELRKAVKAEQRVVRKSGNRTLLEENEGVIADAEARIDNSKEAVKTAQDELREWKRLVKSAQTAVNRAKAVTMKASDPARQVDDGIDPKFLADKFGFDSVDDVLTGTEFDLEEETHQAADKLMEDESPELASTEGIQTAVSEAVNNEALLRVRSSELSVLDKTGPSQSLLMATAKMVAKRVVEGRMFRELATHEDETPAQIGERRNRHAMGLGRKFEIAARKAERDARSARDARDLEAMRKHQRTALQQRALSAEAYSQRDKLRKDMDRITSILKVSGAKRESQLARAYGGAAVESARMMLLAVGLGDEAMARRIAGLSINGQFDPAENSPLSAGDKAELASAVNAAKAIGAETGGDYKRMEIGALREFLVGIDGVLNMARRLRQIQIGDQTVMIEDLAESLKQQADAEGRVIPDNQQKEKENLARRQLGPMNEKWQRMEALLYAMDGNKYGTLTQAIWQPIADAVNRLNEDEVRILNKFKDIVRPLREAVRGDQDLADEITAEYLIDPGTGKPFVFRQGKLGIIGALVHSGSDSNLKRLVHGWKWGLYDADTDTLDRSAWDAQVAAWEASGMVTEADWQMVQAIWDLYDEMLPAMRRAHYDALGFDMVLTERTPVQTRWGEFKGGYVPAALDRDKQPVRQDVRDANEILEAQKQMPTVARGMTQGRVNYDFRALDLDILRQVEHFHKHLMFTHLAAPAKQLLSIVYNDDVNVQLERLYPGFTQNHLKHWIETVTTQSSTLGQHQDIDGAASLWNVLRRNTGSAAMIGNIRNALQGIGGIALAVARVRPRYLMLAAYDYYRSPYRSRDAIQDKSRMMRLRHVKGNNIYEVRDAINELHESGNAFIRNTDKLRAFLAKHTYIAQELIQKPLDRIVWLGAYKQAVDAGKSESVAIREADGAVRQTQHDSTPMSLASGEKGTPLQKLVSQFMGWFVMMASLRGGDFHNQTRLSALMLVLGPMLTTMVIGEIVSEMLDEHEEDDTWDKIALRVAGNSVFSLPRAFGIPGVIASTALQSSVGSALGTAENYQMRMPQPAAFALVGRAMAAGRQWVDAMTSESGKASIADAGTDFIEIVGALFGIPIGVVTNRVQAGVTDEDASVRGFINGR